MSEFVMDKDLLKFVTAGSIDDGKSTLIGKLLYETNGVYLDQYTAIEKLASRKGMEKPELALIVDGLKAEREQGITIDVAYRYFSTSRRKFIIADSPGHIQYTRNMVTGASNVDLAVILVDARKGVLEQTRRHTFLVTLLSIPHILVVINKMDLVDYSEEVFEKIREDYLGFTSKLQIHDLQFMPISALNGDMIVERGSNMDWYQGRTFLNFLENINVASDRNLIDFRFPVQTIIRPNLDYRGYAGKIESGVIHAGDDILVLPAGIKSRIKSIDTFGGSLEYAFAPQSVVLTLYDEIDISRGDILVRTHNLPEIKNEFEAEICWMVDTPMVPDKKYLLKHTSNTTMALIKEIRYRININTLHRENTKTLGLNEIGRVLVQTQKPIVFDTYDRNRALGCFIMIDEYTNDTVAAGIIWHTSGSLPDAGQT